MSRTRTYDAVVDIEAQDTADAAAEAATEFKDESPDMWGIPCLGDLEVEVIPQ